MLQSFPFYLMDFGYSLNLKEYVRFGSTLQIFFVHVNKNLGLKRFTTARRISLIEQQEKRAYGGRSCQPHRQREFGDLLYWK